MRILLTYSSRTGNTKKVADAKKHPNEKDFSDAKNLFKDAIAKTMGLNS